MSETTPNAREDSRVPRWCLLVIGGLFTGLGAVGAFLPVLPTTPFLLLAATCFARSSPALHRRLLANRIFGPYLSEWHHNRTVPREAKRKAYGLIVCSFGVSIALVEVMWLRGVLGVVGALLIGFLAWLPTAPLEEEGGAEDPGDLSE